MDGLNHASDDRNSEPPFPELGEDDRKPAFYQ
jgi:hypothetical protein